MSDDSSLPHKGRATGRSKRTAFRLVFVVLFLTSGLARIKWIWRKLPQWKDTIRATATADRVRNETILSVAQLPEMSAPTTPSPIMEFSWENLACDDPSYQAPCGAKKCFFHLTNASSVGYLVARYDPRVAMVMKDYYRFAQYLSQTYGIESLVLEEPRALQVDASLARDCLDRKRIATPFSPKENTKGSTLLPTFANDQDGSGDYSLLIQANKVVPDPSILFKCNAEKLGAMLRSTETIDRYWGAVKLLDATSIQRYQQNIARGSSQALHILEHESFLLRDFQVLIDLEGNMEYIDLGHLVPKKGRTKTKTPDGVSIPVGNSTATLSRAWYRCRDAFDVLQKYIAMQEWTTSKSNSQ